MYVCTCTYLQLQPRPRREGYYWGRGEGEGGEEGGEGRERIGGGRREEGGEGVGARSLESERGEKNLLHKFVNRKYKLHFDFNLE